MRYWKISYWEKLWWRKWGEYGNRYIIDDYACNQLEKQQNMRDMRDI